MKGIGQNGPIEKRQGANLPHWRQEGAIYAVTFRLADSLPAAVLGEWRRQREAVLERAEQLGEDLTSREASRLAELYSECVEQWLDQGHGSCALRDARITKLVADAIQHFDGSRYELYAWCIMPNHVHVIVEPREGHSLSKILMSWKGFTGKRARELLGGAGPFWQKEAFDHIVRDAGDFAHQVRYVMENPAKAGMKNWPWVWARGGFEDTGRKPGATLGGLSA